MIEPVDVDTETDDMNALGRDAVPDQDLSLELGERDVALRAAGGAQDRTRDVIVVEVQRPEQHHRAIAARVAAP